MKKRNQSSKEKAESGKSVSLLKTFDTQAARKFEQENKRTARNYHATIAKLGAFIRTRTGNANPRLTDIDIPWVQQFASWLASRHPGNPSTAGFYLSNFRAMYNHAAKQGEVAYPAGGYPFAGVSIKVAEPFKRALPQQEVQRLSGKELYRRLPDGCRQSLDLFLFMLFCQGISFQDAYLLTNANIGPPDYIVYTRSKTGVLLKVKLTDEMKLIIHRYSRPDSPYLFPFLHERRRGASSDMSLGEDSALTRTNRHLKQIGERLGTDIPLTTYVMRHTFATLMLASGATVELISQCLGHTSINTTQIYLSKLPTEKLDKATENMLDLCVRIPSEKEETDIPKLTETDIPDKTTKQTSHENEGKRQKKCPFLSKKQTFEGENSVVQIANISKFQYSSKIWLDYFMLFFPPKCYILLKYLIKSV